MIIVVIVFLQLLVSNCVPGHGSLQHACTRVTHGKGCFAVERLPPPLFSVLQPGLFPE